MNSFKEINNFNSDINGSLDNMYFLSSSSHFSFFVLVDEVTKNENRLHDFLYDVFHLQARQKFKNDKKNKQKISYYLNFVDQNVKWNEKDKCY